MTYEVIVTSVHDRGDLLDQTLRSMLQQLDQRPARVIVHEDVRAGQAFASGRTEDMLATIELEHKVPTRLIQTIPGTGLARGLLRVLEAADTDLVFYTQEDFDFIRPVPIARCLEIMEEHELHQVRFNKRKTMAVKGADRPAREQFRKVEVAIGGQILCIADRWYHQAAVWRRSVALDAYRAVVSTAAPDRIVERCEDKVDHWINRNLGGGVGSIDGDQEARRERCRTFIWGGVGEPAFVRHTGGDRRSQGWG